MFMMYREGRGPYYFNSTLTKRILQKKYSDATFEEVLGLHVYEVNLNGALPSNENNLWALENGFPKLGSRVVSNSIDNAYKQFLDSASIANPMAYLQWVSSYVRGCKLLGN
jgi:hypothetical protein